MALRLEDKKALVAEVNAVASEALAAVAAEYRGLTVEEMNALRVKAREKGVYLRVVKNNLARRAIKDTDFECMGESLVGPLVLAFSREDPSSAARVVRDFAKEHDKLVPHLIAIGGEALPGSEISRLADLPTLDEARAQLLGTLEAPLGQLVRTLNEVPSQVARVLDARSREAA